MLSPGLTGRSTNHRAIGKEGKLLLDARRARMTMVHELAPQTRPTTEVKPLRSYGRRKAKPLSARKERLIADLLPKLKLDLKAPTPRCLQDLFPVLVREVWLEIGFGSGEHFLFQAGHHIDIGFIGCETFVNGGARLLGGLGA